MNKVARILLLMTFMNGLMLTSWADRGVGKKKAKVSLNLANVSTPANLSLNVRSGMKYRGSLLSGSTGTKTTILYSNLVTYQKGNTIYIIPTKQKVVVPEMKQGYTGMKLILKPRS